MVKNVDTDPLRQMMIKGIIESCQKYSIRVIGEGVETKEELHTLISLGVDFGQGYFLQKPDPEMKDLKDDVKGLICQYNSEVNPQRTNMFLWDEIGTIVHREQPVLAEESGEVLYQAFHHDHSLSEFCVVSKDSHVEGLITRRRLMETYGGLYGYNLYRRSTAGRLVEKDALIVDCKESIKTVAARALARPKEAVYDAIIVTNKGRYLGIVTMQDLLETTISIQVSQARSANPLTGLPGNNIIHAQLESVIHDESKAVVYFDLDNFKAYNDNYGFQNGDKMIQLMADCIQSACTNEFIGHIGGDDMMLIVDQDKAEIIVTEILHAFRLHAIHLYSREDQQRGCIIAKDREGSQKQFLLASLSAAGVDITPQITSVEALMQKITTVKKLAKAVRGNSFVYMKKGYDVPVQVIPGK
ncbi:MAG: GGDEF domain-containing protein [Lactimicrobium sp.]|jgi:GGDEF domain-containing protein|uniref:GGDEF domain-containing protein n=1 Tax=Lactimicrobium sp. TaxID=2563780 RepID=UPI002F3509FF